MRTNGSVECWGRADERTDAPGGRFSTVTAGFGHSCGLRTDGTIECWGLGQSGEADAPD
ncbi:MAG: hypothetical protein F4236_06230, partial [Acidimicrobiia bacterium]|nr:hypothetical protein [Acidimicrobiia bacterium]